VARAGLLSRAGFYLALAYLTARIAVLPGPTGRQTNAQGARGFSIHGSDTVAIP